MTKKAVKKISFRLHPAPIVGFMVAIIMLAFFNAQLLTALALNYVTPATQDGQQVVVGSTVFASETPKIVIPKISVDAPVVYGMNSVKEGDVQGALEDGVLHFGGSPLPGQPGNAVFVGHSSNLPWAPGDYKFVFMFLDRLEKGDQIYLDFNKARYTYEVTDKKVVKPNDVSVLEGSIYPIATFITCTPVGTNTNRLVISAKLIDPEPLQGDVDAQLRSAPELNGALPGQGRDVL